MTRSISRARRAALLLAGGATVATTLLLAGCGAGQIAETAKIEPAISGVNVQSDDGSFKVRDLGVDYLDTAGYRAGGDATVHAVLYNDGQTAISVRISSSSAASVVLATGPAPSAVPGADQVTQVPGGASASPGASTSAGAPSTPFPGGLPGTGTPSPSTSTEPGAGPDATASVPAVPAGPAVIQIPAHGFVVLGRNAGSYLRLVGLTSALAPGQAVQLTFEVNGQQITTPAPVAVPLTPAPTAPPVSTGEEHG
ncbi:hypothetical protein [Plantactinospora sp. KBS50]|uniref:hypothetical protein n=1 Tax=Plantactinospora sp. KBS50 TaxID=2024580 RepID=UPI000BAAD0DF|nr:hypothetical protein [Plantactinospora sp. KBS50]ASW57002.1 hypothetical protein CIK06_26865 [Plantactinospora sp. KBS50]